MAKDKVTVTLDPEVISATDADAADEGLNRSEYLEKVLRDAHYRRQLSRVTAAPLPAHEASSLRDLLVWQANPGTAA